MKEQIIKDFPMYKIREDGKVFSKHKTKNKCKSNDGWHELNSVLDKRVGYYLVTLVNKDTKIRKNQFIHRLLGEAFIYNDDPDNKVHINHKDGNKQNNDLTNLEWVTPKENAQHAVNMGLTHYEYCEKPVLQIDKYTGEIIAEYKSQREAQDATGTARQNISKVVRGIRKYAGGYIWKYK